VSAPGRRKRSLRSAQRRGKHASAGETASRFGAEGSGASIYVADPDGNTVELKGPPWSR